VISSVESYSQFLPFLTASTVTARDPETGYPTQAFLTVGYGPLSETFTSRVICDVEKLTVEANSGAKYGEKDGQDKSSGLSGFFPGANEGLFEYLTTRWELVPLSGTQGPLTKVNLEVRFEFRSQMHATIMSSVEGQMAGVMIEAFEKRMREVEGKGQ
jgi:coenzyme Q-binding protein COQ10